MRNQLDPTKDTAGELLAFAAHGALSATAASRRHALLKGISKGAAVLVASIPIQTLAGQNLLTEDLQHACSVSGMHSGIHSATTTTVTCGGYSPGWWKQEVKDSNPPTPRRAWPTLPNSWTYATPCNSVFTKSTFSTSLFDVMRNQPSSDEYHWICAWLNALNKSFNFPYTGQKVLDFYNGNETTTPKYSDALTFFKNFMETHPPT